MKNKSEALENFKEIHAYAVNVNGEPNQDIRTGNEGEYSSKEF